MRVSVSSLAFAVAASAASTAALAQTTPPALSVHGYLTQGYGVSNRDTVLGLTPNGTSDYRRAAIVGRYSVSPSDHFVVQVGHRRLGNSPTMRFEDNIKVDAAFYEHRFGFGTSVRVGKAALPSGIFNDTRYVGTLLPFYRVPFSVYGEGAYVSETINGAIASHDFDLGSSWSLSAQGYVGDFGLLEQGVVVDAAGNPTFAGAPMESKNVLGGQLWLRTPVDGVRLGFGGRRKDDYGGLYDYFRAEDRSVVDATASFDAAFERWQLRAETNRVFATNFNFKSEYVQAGFSPRSWLSINAQSEFFHLDADVAPATRMRLSTNRDDAIGVNFSLNPTSVLKLEQHRTKGFNYEQVVNPFGPRLRGSYFILSLSTAF